MVGPRARRVAAPRVPPRGRGTDLKDGKTVWQLPIEQALGPGVDLSGGWAFGATGDKLVGYVAPYTNPQTKQTSTFGLFSVRLSNGMVDWMRPSVVRVYPSGNPAFAPVVRPVDQQGQYGGFARLDADTGRVVGQITPGQVPGSGWWLAFPGDMEKLGFLKRNAAGSVFDLATGEPTPVKGTSGWSFCVTDPKPLPLRGLTPGFYSIAALCEFDLASGKRITSRPHRPPGSRAARTAGGCGGTRRARCTPSRTAPPPPPACTDDQPKVVPGRRVTS